MLNFLNKRRKKGQSTLEYAILIIIIIGALLSIQVYIKRGVQGRLKGAADDIGDQFSGGNTNYIFFLFNSWRRFFTVRMAAVSGSGSGNISADM